MKLEDWLIEINKLQCYVLRNNVSNIYSLDTIMYIVYSFKTV